MYEQGFKEHIEDKKQKLLKYHLMFGTGDKEKDQMYINIGYWLIYKYPNDSNFVFRSLITYDAKYVLTDIDIYRLTISVAWDRVFSFSLEGNTLSSYKEIIK